MSAIQRVSNEQDIEIAAQLAHKIWNQHYTPIIGQAQVDYMLQKFQSSEAIRKQLNEGYEYYLLTANEHPQGYLGIIPNSPAGKLMISKIYVDAEARGSGYGRRLLDFALDLSKNRGFQSIWLTVNRHNKNTVAWYQKRGFKVVKEAKMDIGNGYFMDDYVMEMPL